MDDMMDSAGKLMGSADDMVKNINAIIGDEKTQAAMRGSIQHIDDITGKTSQMMDANAGNIQQITANMAAMTAQITRPCRTSTAMARLQPTSGPRRPT